METTIATKTKDFLIFDYLFNETHGTNKAMTTREIADALKVNMRDVHNALNKYHRKNCVWKASNGLGGRRENTWSAELTVVHLQVANLWREGKTEDAIWLLIEKNAQDHRIGLTYSEAKKFLERNYPNWEQYDKKLNKLFGCCGFDLLEKLGYDIWFSKGEDEYETALMNAKIEWNKLKSIEKADKFMHALNCDEAWLKFFLFNTKDYSDIN